MAKSFTAKCPNAECGRLVAQAEEYSPYCSASCEEYHTSELSAVVAKQFPERGTAIYREVRRFGRASFRESLEE